MNPQGQRAVPVGKARLVLGTPSMVLSSTSKAELWGHRRIRWNQGRAPTKESGALSTQDASWDEHSQAASRKL